MKIIRVIVDQLPKSCSECSRHLNLAYNCSVENYMELYVMFKRAGRLPNCPLALEHDDKQVDAEVV